VRRRELVGLVGGSVLVSPIRAPAQKRVPHIVYLWLGPAGSDTKESLPGFQAGLADLGYLEGRNIIIDYRYADGSEARLSEVAAEAIAQRPDLIYAIGPVVSRAVARFTKTIPIVSFTGDPVAIGLASSLSRPGGNVTGMAVMAEGMAGKWLELLRELVSSPRRVAVLRNALSPASAAQKLKSVAERLVNAPTVEEYLVRNADELVLTLEAIRRAKPDALVVDNEPLLVARANDVAAVGLPAISGSREFVVAGLLASYGSRIFEVFRRSVIYVDRILKGARPEDLPIEQPSKFELVINLKTARTLGLTISPLILARADEVIE
jgi:putative tryptophan/tyrosine transport system substrate-binding protein